MNSKLRLSLFVLLFCSLILAVTCERVVEQKESSRRAFRFVQQTEDGERDDEGFYTQTARRYGNRRRKGPPQPDGSLCKFNQHCESGCCVTGTKSRKCAPKAKLNQRCTIGQIKGGVYDKFCPCSAGEVFCSHRRGKASICRA